MIGKSYKFNLFYNNMYIKIGDKIVCNDVKFCKCFSKFKGLMFSKKLKDNQCLILNNASAIHMWFVFQNIDVVWLYNNRVVDKKECVKSFTFLVKPRFEANSVVELPLGKAKLFKLGNKVYFDEV